MEFDAQVFGQPSFLYMLPGKEDIGAVYWKLAKINGNGKTEFAQFYQILKSIFVLSSFILQHSLNPLRPTFCHLFK